MIVFNYTSKKELKENVGNRLDYIETSMFGNEYISNGQLTGANRPHITGKGRDANHVSEVHYSYLTGEKL
jgi:hypothetical protein